MNFNQFKDKINTLKNKKLGGLEAQYRVAPKLRLQYSQEKIKALTPKKAAVLSVFYPNQSNDTCFLLTQRASYKGIHSAQISFPGGKIDESDIDLEETALREAFEEVGLIKKSVELIRELTEVYIPPSNFLVTPFIGFTDKEPIFKTNNEVHKTIEVLASDLLDDKNISSVEMNTSYMKNVEVPCFKLNNSIVWGATAMILSEIKDLLK